MSPGNLVLSFAVAIVMLTPAALIAQEEEERQDRASMAIDSTATQWSFQFAYQTMPSYYQDTMDNGRTRPKGNDNYWQLRIVAPIPKSESVPFTLLPRLTIREEENQLGQSGFGSTELFVLGIVDDWGTGRWGIGPLVNFPGSKKVSTDKWGVGLAGAVVNTSGPWFYGVLFTQSWRERDPTLVSSGIAPLGIAPIVNYRSARASMSATVTWSSAGTGTTRRFMRRSACVSARSSRRKRQAGTSTESTRPVCTTRNGWARRSRTHGDST